MFNKIAIKIAVIIILVVTVVSILSVINFNKSNTDLLTTYLNSSVADIARYGKIGYSEHLWNYNLSGISKLSEAFLKNKMIIAINVYDTSDFISGYTKATDTSDFKFKKLSKAFRLSSNDLHIKKVSRKIQYENKPFGSFDLFYTEQFVDEAAEDANLKMLISFMIIAVLIIITIFISVNKLTIKPILELSSLSKKIVNTSDYSLRVTKKENRHDEIGALYEGFNNMLEQISGKDTERSELFDELQQSETHFRSLFDNLQGAIEREQYSLRITPESDKDDLAISLNMMLQALETSDLEAKNQDWLKTGQTKLSDRISGEQEIDELCRNAITYIAKYVGAQVGTVFVKDADMGDFRLVANYAYKSRKGLANRFKPGEGLVGQAALEKMRIVFTEVPDDYIKIESSLGNLSPKNILILPLVFEGDVKGVIELGAAFEFTEAQIMFADLVGGIVAVAINAALANAQMKTLLDKTREQAEELRVQQDELQKANQELEEQTLTLKESEAKLQIQQEELQASNEEMEEKTEMLERQKDEIEKSNRVLQEKQKEIEEKAGQLELSTKYKSEFLSNMSHELRTPLNSLLLLAKMLSENDEKNLTEDQIESAASIHRSGQNLLRLINDILDLSKIEAKKIELSISKMKISTLAANFKSEFKHMAKEKGLEFNTDIQEGLPDTIVTDTLRFEQIIRNLLSNALKFTAHGSVSLIVSRPDSSVKLDRKDVDLNKAMAISVADTGTGIPEDQLKLIFEAFKQVDGSISRRYGGTGLGLSISKELSKLIGGELKVESTPGEGAVFTLYIPEILRTPRAGNEAEIEVSAPEKVAEIKTEPSEKPEETIKETPVKEPEISRDSEAKTMLIIEDDNEFAGILANFFQKNGYESIIASDGESGIKYVLEHKPTGIILDIGLPGIDGWAVLNELKNNPDTRHIPVHIMSAYDNVKEGLEKGAVGYLTKPVSTEGLKTALNRIEDVLTSDVKELLVVEDDNDLRNGILKLMKTHDINATEAATGEETLNLLKQKRFDCLILDLGLPDISGFDLLDKIENDTSIEKTPVIIYTGRDLTKEETDRLERYSSSIVLKSAGSFERLLDETALFMHRVEGDMPEKQQEMIQGLRDKESVLTGKKVLVVDDDMRNAFALNKFLKSRGMEVSIADNGKKALDLLETSENPDIVLMDIMMPVMDGYETMKMIRKNNKLKDLPILALTAKAMESDREECIRSGANDYLSKPVDTTKLISMLRVWLY